MLHQATFLDSSNATSLPASAGGPLPCNLPDGQKIDPSGQCLAPASHSAELAKEKEQVTKGTSGRSPSISSESASLTSLLVNRLKMLLPTDGLMEYAQTWKEKTTPAGTSRWAHTASSRRTSEPAFTGWPSATANDSKGGQPAPNREGSPMLKEAAHLAGWPTPQVAQGPNMSENRGAEHGGRRGRQTAQSVEMIMAGWPTASARDWKDTAGMATTGTNPDGTERSRLDQLPRVAQLVAGWGTPRVTTNSGTGSPERAADGLSRLEDQVHGVAGWVSPTATDGSRGSLPPRPQDTGVPLSQQVSIIGPTPSGFPAETESTAGYQLNPRFSLWLMGFPTSWHDAGVSALRSLREPETPSCPKSPQPSSVHS